MAAYLPLIVLAAILSQGFCVREIRLPDESYRFITNQLIGKTLTIPKSFLDTLQTCHVIFPNGVMFEAYPNDRTPHDTIFFLKAVQPFTSCGIGFLSAHISLSGTYELLSVVRHSADGSQSLTRRRFHLTLVDVSPGIMELKSDIEAFE